MAISRSSAPQPAEDQPFRLAVQWINRDAGFRGYAGTVLGGSVRPGDEVVVLPSGVRARVGRIVTYEGDLERAVAGQAVTLTLDPAVDVGRGDCIGAAGAPPHVSDQFAAHIVWLGDEPMLPGRPYLLRLGTATTTATVSELKHRLDVASGSQRPRQAARAQRHRLLPTCRSTARWPSTPTTTTARPAASS